MTTWFLTKERPRIVWFQFSLVLGVALALYKRCFPRLCETLVADIHTKALRRDGGRFGRFAVRPIKGWVLRACSRILVTNPENADFATQEFGVSPNTLTDPLPSPPPGVGPPAVDERNAGQLAHGPVVFICSYARDEPVGLIIETLEIMGEQVDALFTGDPSRLKGLERRQLSAVGRFTGFLPDPEYWALLRSASAVVVLTDEPACLPCGAYEAIAVERRPVLLEDRRAQVVFSGLALFVAPTPKALAAVIREARGPRGELDRAAIEGYEREWTRDWEALNAGHNGGSTSPSGDDTVPI